MVAYCKKKKIQNCYTSLLSLGLCNTQFSNVFFFVCFLYLLWIVCEYEVVPTHLLMFHEHSMQWINRGGIFINFPWKLTKIVKKKINKRTSNNTQKIAFKFFSRRHQKPMWVEYSSRIRFEHNANFSST